MIIHNFWDDLMTFIIGAGALGIIAQIAKMAIMTLFDSDDEEER